MGNCCTSSSSMDWGGEDWESLRSSPSSSSKPKKPCPSSSSISRNKVFDESAHHVEKDENNNLLRKLRDSSDSNGKVTLKISKSELAELLGAIQQNNDQHEHEPQKKQMKKLASSAEEVLFRLIKTRDHQIITGSHWKPVLDTIQEC